MTDSLDSLPYRPDDPDVVEIPAHVPVPAPGPAGAIEPPPRRNRIAVVGLVFAVLALVIFGIPFLFLINDTSGWAGLQTIVIGMLLAWPATILVGISAVVLSSVGVRRSRDRGRRRLATVALVLAILGTVAALALEFLVVLALSGAFYTSSDYSY